jgi:hypothetical protein
MPNTILPVDERVEERSAHADGFGSKTQRFYNIGATSDAAVDVDFNLLEYFGTVLAYLE